jgi:hypothetical protein
MHVLPGGEVACLGNGQDLIFFNSDTQTWREIDDAGVTPHGDDDLAVLLGPVQAAKILHKGGGAVDDSGVERGVAAAQIIDLTADNPAWGDIAPMAKPRWFPSAAYNRNTSTEHRWSAEAISSALHFDVATPIENHPDRWVLKKLPAEEGRPVLHTPLESRQSTSAQRMIRTLSCIPNDRPGCPIADRVTRISAH